MVQLGQPRRLSLELRETKVIVAKKGCGRQPRRISLGEGQNRQGGCLLFHLRKIAGNGVGADKIEVVGVESRLVVLEENGNLFKLDY